MFRCSNCHLYDIDECQECDKCEIRCCGVCSDSLNIRMNRGNAGEFCDKCWGVLNETLKWGVLIN